MLEDIGRAEVDCRASATSSIDIDEDVVSRPPTSTQRPPTTPSSMSSHRPTASPSSASSHSRCSCSRRVTDIRAFGGGGGGFHSDGDVDDAVAMETRQRLQRSLRSTTSEGGAFRRVEPSRPALHQRSHSNGSVSASTPRDRDVTHADPGDWTKGVEARRKGLENKNPDKTQQQYGYDAADRLTGIVVEAGSRVNGRRNLYEVGDWATAGRFSVENGQRRRLACTEAWSLNGDSQPVSGRRRRRGRQVLSVVKSGAGLRAISETGDTCRVAVVSTSLAADVSHPVIRGLYRQPLPVPAASLATVSLASSSASSTSAASAAGRAESDDSCSTDESRQSSV